MQRGMRNGWLRLTALIAALATGGTTLLSLPAQANLLHEATERRKPHLSSELPTGKTDKLTAAQWKAVDAQYAKASKHKPKLRLLNPAEMRKAVGRGPYRNRGFSGTLPWQKSLRDVNLCNGNLFKSFSDILVNPAVGTGLVLQRTYNSNDDRVGPFGIGWTHAYDIRMEEDPTNTPTDVSLNFADRTDFIGGKRKYHRDADGLYSPPAYIYDEMSSDYDHFLTDGPQNVLADTDKSMDGTIKHYTQIGNERVCDSITDRYNNVTLLTYSPVSIGGVNKGLLDTVTDPSGRILLFHWQDLNAANPAQPAWRIVQVDGPQYSVGYTYNADFNLSASTLDVGDNTHLNRTTTYGYTSVTGDSGTENGLLASITDPLGHSILYGYGLMTPDAPVRPTVTGTVWANQITEPAGIDAQGNPRTQTWIVTSLGGEGVFPSSVNAYTTSNGNHSYVDGSLLLRVNTDSYLRAGGVSANFLSDGPANGTTYDSANNVIETETVSGLTDSAAPASYLSARPRFDHIDRFTYGPHGNQLTHTQDGFPGVETMTYYNGSQYFAKASVTDLNGHTSTFGVGSNTDPNPGNRGSILWARDAGYNDASSSSYQKQFSYQYNTAGHKTQEVNLNGVVIQYSYGDPWGNLTQVVQDPHVSNGDSHLARTTSMAYDVSGRVVSSTDPMAQTSNVSFNGLGQPLSVTCPPTANTAAETVAYGYDANGRTLTVTNNRGTTTMAYESGCNRVHSVADPVTGTVSYSYLATGERASMTLPGGGTWTYGYAVASAETGLVLPNADANSIMRRLTTITDDQGRRVEYALNPDGTPLLARVNEVFNTNPTSPTLLSYQQTEYTYDTSAAGMGPALTHHWLTQLKNTYHWLDANNNWQSKLLVQNDYTQDATGQRQTNTISSLDANGNIVSRTEQYGYDALDRLKTVNYGDGQTQSYSFDAMWNRLSKQDSTTGTENYTYNAANMLLTRGANNYANDINGNTLTGSGRTNTWDSQNRMVQCVNGANMSSFIYGADGIRRQSTANGTTTDFILDHSMFVREKNHATHTNTATYLVGARGPEYRRDDTTGQVRWYLYDGLGNVLGEIDPNGNITSNRKYDVYGLVRGGNNPGGMSSHKFVGQLGHPSEDNTGLIYMRARYYDPGVGRFASEDPVGQGSNWFIYGFNSPTTQVDASGKATLQEVVTTNAIEGGMAAAGGGGAVEAGEHLAEELGECVAVHELQIEQWLDGGFMYTRNKIVDIGEYVISRSARGIEITSTAGEQTRTVFIDIMNKFGEKNADHIQGIHIDFQSTVKGTDIWDQIALNLDSFGAWKGK